MHRTQMFLPKKYFLDIAKKLLVSPQPPSTTRILTGFADTFQIVANQSWRWLAAISKDTNPSIHSIIVGFIIKSHDSFYNGTIHYTIVRFIVQSYDELDDRTMN